MDKELKTYLDRHFKTFATKDDLKGFATKNDLKAFATKDDLKNFTTKDDLKNLVTKEDLDEKLANFTTKDDLRQGLAGLENSLKAHIDDRTADLGEVINETIAVPLEQLIRSARDYPLVKGDVKRIKKVLHMID